MYQTKLQVDIDFKPKLVVEYGDVIAGKLMFFTKLYNFELWVNSVVVKETVKGYHLRIGLISKKELSDYEVLYMQQALGDDYIRAGFNLIRILGGEQPRLKWNLLFTNKEKESSFGKFMQKSILKTYYLRADRYKEKYDRFFKSKKFVKAQVQPVWKHGFENANAKVF